MIIQYTISNNYISEIKENCSLTDVQINSDKYSYTMFIGCGYTPRKISTITDITNFVDLNTYSIDRTWLRTDIKHKKLLDQFVRDKRLEQLL